MMTFLNNYIIQSSNFDVCSSGRSSSSAINDETVNETDEERIEPYVPIKSVGNDHRVSGLSDSRLSHHDLQCMQHGTTVVRWDSNGHVPATVVLLRLENDGRTLSWTRPVWGSLRCGTGVLVGAAGGQSSAATAA